MSSSTLAKFTIAISALFYCCCFQSPNAHAFNLKQTKERLVYLRVIDKTIIQDIRYAGNDNFMGRPVPGYDAAECLLLRPVAEALARVQLQLRKRKLSLKVYDCYRPERAVKSFVAWLNNPEGSTGTSRFYPFVYKRDLLRLGYISSRSAHSRGIAVDLTLVQLPAPTMQDFDPFHNYAPCTGPANERAPDTSVDMGTGFDCFDVKAHTFADNITAVQRSWRKQLLKVMMHEGFKNYTKEWWHFSYLSVNAAESFDFPIIPRRKEK